MTFKKQETRHSETTINFSKEEMFFGMVIVKTQTVSVCTGAMDTQRKDGNMTRVLVWDCEHKPTGLKRTKWTSIPLRMGDIPSTQKAFTFE